MKTFFMETKGLMYSSLKLMYFKNTIHESQKCIRSNKILSVEGSSLIKFYMKVSAFQEWNDMNLRWNTSEYGGVRDLRIPPHRLWKPDVLMYNR